MISKIFLMGAVSIALSGCGGSSNDKVNVPVPVPIPVPVPDPVREIDYTLASETAIGLGIPKVHITTDEPVTYTLELEESDLATIVFSLGNGTSSKEFGNPDIYVKYNDDAVAGEDGNFDCSSTAGDHQNEVCIIDNPKAGEYSVLIDTKEPLNDATLSASVGIFETSAMCGDDIRLRFQASKTDEEVKKTCDELALTKNRFKEVLGDFHPTIQTPVVGNLNDITNINIFKSMTNHMALAEHLYNTNSDGGIYYETAPDKWNHDSTILTFDALEQTGGYSVIGSLQHEYVHALDARYNRKDGPEDASLWWTEGLAQYVGVHYKRSYQAIADSTWGPFSLKTIMFGEHDTYFYESWGALAVQFLLEERPVEANNLLVLMRMGEWKEVKRFQWHIARNYNDLFTYWYNTELKENYEEQAVELKLGEYDIINGRGGWLYKLTLEKDQPITIRTNGGSSDVSLWVMDDISPVTRYWCDSITHGTNEESCYISNATAGDYYIGVAAPRFEPNVVDLRVSACAGKDCTVEQPEPVSKITVDEPYLMHWPEKGSIGTCTLLESYGVSQSKKAGDISVKNSTDTGLNIYSVPISGEKPGVDHPDEWDTLMAGGKLDMSGYRIGQRFMIGDEDNNCLGVMILNDTLNEFEIEQEILED